MHPAEGKGAIRILDVCVLLLVKYLMNYCANFNETQKILITCPTDAEQPKSNTGVSCKAPIVPLGGALTQITPQI